MESVKIIECPRDAMQGIHSFIPTEVKINYLNHLLTCGFDTLDFGSFVSPKAIPQMADTKEVLKGLHLAKTSTKLLAIIANERGATDAATYDEIHYLGYPFSVSETFQQRNTNASISESLQRVEEIQNICLSQKKQLVVYLSMGFGNPYGDPWEPEIVAQWSEKLYNDLGIDILALSDTIGCATKESVHALFSELIPSLPKVEFGAHLHVRPENAVEIAITAFDAGCRRFDGAIKGFGGCPMAKDDLTGNMPTELLLEALAAKANTGVSMTAFEDAYQRAANVFPA